MAMMVPVCLISAITGLVLIVSANALWAFAMRDLFSLQLCVSNRSRLANAAAHIVGFAVN